MQCFRDEKCLYLKVFFFLGGGYDVSETVLITTCQWKETRELLHHIWYVSAIYCRMRKKVWKFSQLIRMSTLNSKYERANRVLAPVDNSILYMTHTVKPRNWQMHAPGDKPVKSSPRSHWGKPYIQLCSFQSITFFNILCTHTGNRGENQIY